MAHQEEFADPVVVPGPNVRSLFTDTEEVDGGATGFVDEDAGFCPTCHGVLPATTVRCPADGTVLVVLPPITGV